MYCTECHTNALTTFLFVIPGFGGLMGIFYGFWVIVLWRWYFGPKNGATDKQVHSGCLVRKCNLQIDHLPVIGLCILPTYMSPILSYPILL